MQNLKILSKILDLNKIEAVNKPISEANGLPNECYTNEDYTKYERDTVLSNNWIVIGSASSVPEIGDAKPFNLLGIPLVIIRNRNKLVKVFHNVCSHRGLKLINETCKLKNVIRCPYHSWSYSFNGELVATPHLGGMNKHEVDGFNRIKSNLKEVRSKIWMDLIFINLNNNAKEFDRYVQPLENRWSKYITKEDQKLIYHAKNFGYFNIEVNSNWKLAIENYCESYHLPWIHPELNKVSNIEDHYHIEDSKGTFSGQGSKKYTQQFDGNRKFKTFPNWSNELNQNSEYVSFFPNVMLGIHIDHFYAFWLEPLAYNKTREHFEMYYIGEESAESDNFKYMRENNLKFWKGVMNEDVDVIQGMQAGRNSPVYNGGNFSPVMDSPTLMFHRWVVNKLINQ